jgi:hypothetical protein
MMVPDPHFVDARFSTADFSPSDLQENYEAEVLLAASKHLGSFSDEELVTMVGF